MTFLSTMENIIDTVVIVKADEDMLSFVVNVMIGRNNMIVDFPSRCRVYMLKSVLTGMLVESILELPED